MLMEKRRRTVLVLGAGASLPVGFPLGRELALRASTIDRGMAELLERAGAPSDQIQEFPNVLRKAAPSSIDALLEHRTEFIPIGKLLIALHLIPYEHPDTLFSSDHPRSWYNYLYGLIASGPAKDLFKNDQLSVITFNYDRSLEAALLQKVQYTHNLSDADAREVVRRIPIVHVHGSLGPLPGEAEESRAYSNAVTPATLQMAAQSITVIHEGAPQEPLEKAHRLLRLASDVVFLGHGFLPANMQRLGLEQNCTNRHVGYQSMMLQNVGVPDRAQFHGTAIDRTVSERKLGIEPLFERVGGIRLGRNDEDALEFLRNHNELFIG